MSKDIEDKIPLSKAFFYVALSVVVIWGTLFVAWNYHSYTQSNRQNNPHFNIRGIVASTSGRDALSTDQIASLLHLSCDEPTNLYAIDPKEAKTVLESFPAIQTAAIRRFHPSALFVDYELREPYVKLVDFEQVALDKNGYPFPLTSIYTPKNIPEVYLNVQDLVWNRPLDSKEFKTALSIVAFAKEHFPRHVHLVRVDTHSMSAMNRGKKEIVVVVALKERKLFLRLAASNYEQGLLNFLALLPTCEEKGEGKEKQVIDLRPEGFALIT